MIKPKLIGIAPQLIVADVRKTAEYYRDFLGFNIIGIIGEKPVYAMIERDGFQIHFAKSDVSIIKTNKDFCSLSHDLIIWVPEIDEFFEELFSKNATIINGIIKCPYGNREFVIEDCDGHRILVCD